MGPLPLSGSAVPTSEALIPAGVRPGCSWRSRAAAPATCGAAIDVPDMRYSPGPYSALDIVERISTPGATRSGFRPNDWEGPREENEAIRSVVSVPRRVTETFPAASLELNSVYWVESMPMTTRWSIRSESPEASIRAGEDGTCATPGSGCTSGGRASPAAPAANTGPSLPGSPASTPIAPRRSASCAHSNALAVRYWASAATSIRARTTFPRTSPTRSQSSGCPRRHRRAAP